MSGISASDPSRHLHFNLLDMAAPSHNNYGLWRLPENEKKRFHSVAFWKETAKACEDALMDALFLADATGISAMGGDGVEVSIREGIHVPGLDPAIVAASILDSTTQLGFGITQSTTYDNPFTVARRLATLDHLSNGRIGWNIVMSYLPSANENHGLDAKDISSAERYDRSEDFMAAAYKLFEGSWEDDAVVADPEAGVYADPTKVHRIDHVGEHYRSSGPSMVDPSPQRTPLLFQAGMSDRGRLFAAKHAEVVFVVNRNDEGMHSAIRDLRAKAAGFGRTEADMKILPMVSIIAGATQEEAEAKLTRYNSFTKAEGYLIHEFGGSFNPTKFPRSMRLDDAMESAGFARNDSGAYGHGPDATIGDVIDAASDLSNERFFICGDPNVVADALEQWADDFGVNGYNMRNYTHPGTVRDFGNHVVPELQRRGRYRLEYEGTTLREHVFGAGNTHISATHTAASYRS